MLEKSVSGVTNMCINDNKEYTTQTVFYLLISFRHLFIILIRIFKHYNLIQFNCASCLLILFYAKGLLIYQYNIC